MNFLTDRRHRRRCRCRQALQPNQKLLWSTKQLVDQVQHWCAFEAALDLGSKRRLCQLDGFVSDAEIDLDWRDVAAEEEEVNKVWTSLPIR
uniref:Uncharacterized protein n=1 Tax=Hyaloperonospora arabidopsidis (strain Emoy2) TaxID=559515 RepID=M4B578_HYAAE